jgi:hypothetical protein
VAHTTAIEKSGVYVSPKERVLCDVPVLRARKRRLLFFLRSPESITSILVTNYRILCIRKDWDKQNNLMCQRIFSLSLRDIAYVDVATRWGLGVQELGIEFRSTHSSLLTIGAQENFFARIFSPVRYLSLIKVGEVGEKVLCFITEARINWQKRFRSGTKAKEAIVSQEATLRLQQSEKQREAFFAGIQRALNDKDWQRVVQLCQHSEDQFGFSGNVAQAFATAKMQLHIRELRDQLDESLQKKDYDAIVSLCDSLLEEEPGSEDIRKIREEYLPLKERKDAQKEINKAVREKRLQDALELLQTYTANYPSDNQAQELAKQVAEKIPLYLERFKKQIMNLLEQKRLAEAVDLVQSEPKWLTEHPEVSRLCAAGVLLLEGFELQGKGKTSDALKRLKKAVSLGSTMEYVGQAIAEGRKALLKKRSKYRRKFFIPAVLITLLGAALLVISYTVMLSANLFLASIVLLIAALSLATFGLSTSYLIKDTAVSKSTASPETERA